MLEAEPDLSDAALARRLTERAKVAISRRTVAKYRMALGIRRQRTLKEAIAEAMASNPKVTDGEIAAMLTASTGKPVSFKTVAWNRLRLGLRKNREPLPPGRKHRTPLSVTCKKISEAMKERHAKSPLSEEARRRSAEAQKRRWAAQEARRAA
jgi:hypothetical protein